MNKLFAALLFFCVVGASVLWWLMKALPDSPVTPAPRSQTAESLTGTAVPTDEKTEADLVLRVDTIPQGARVEIAGVYLGVTPLDVPLTEKKKAALIVLDGYDVYRRDVPSLATTDGAELNWKITLKAKASEITAAEVKKEIKTVDTKKALKNIWLRGSQGPYFIQIKAVRESMGKVSIQDEVAEYRTALDTTKIFGCLVNLGQRGKWFRILAGPYPARAEATADRGAWTKRRPEVSESFVTGRQSCI